MASDAAAKSREAQKATCPVVSQAVLYIRVQHPNPYPHQPWEGYPKAAVEVRASGAGEAGRFAERCGRLIQEGDIPVAGKTGGHAFLVITELQHDMFAVNVLGKDSSAKTMSEQLADLVSAVINGRASLDSGLSTLD